MIDDSWDLTMHRIAPHIDGINHVARIAEYADVDIGLVEQAIRQFVRFGLVVLLDIFQYGAVYAPTPGIQRLLFDSAFQDECARFAATDAGTVSSDVIVKLYTSLSHGVPLKAWMIDHQDLLGSIDVRRFIVGGLLKGIIYRVHRYAVKDSLDKTNPSTRMDDELEQFLDGAHSFDEICVRLIMTPQDLYTKLGSRKDVYIIER